MAEDLNFNNESLRHFVELARRGDFGGASSGEIRARKLADVALEQIGGLDDEAQQGFAEFCRLASASYWTARKLIGMKS